PETALDEKRLAFHETDMETAVFNPGAAYMSESYLQNGAILDQIVVDARLKYLAGQIDEAGLTAELERWTASRGQHVIDEMNELYQQGVNCEPTGGRRLAEAPPPSPRGLSDHGHGEPAGGGRPRPAGGGRASGPEGE